MVWLAALLELLQFLECLTSPLGLAGVLWIGLYLGLIAGLQMEPSLAALAGGLVAGNFYWRLTQSH